MAARVNAVVVGSGAAGGIVAKELAVAGLSVVVLEKGRQFSSKDASHDELSGSDSIPGNITKLENLDKNPRSFRSDASTPARVMAAGFNAFGVGGGTPWYGAAAWRFHEEHFRMRSSYGRPDGTNLEDWPISIYRPGTVLREGRVRIGSFRTRRCGSIRSPAKEALSGSTASAQSTR